MYYTEQNGVKLPALGMGGLHLPFLPGGDRKIDFPEASNLIEKAYASGVNYFDTAHMYENGESERLIGETMAKYPRETYMIGTKYHCEVAQEIDREFNCQLERLQTDYVDFYMLHGLDEDEYPYYVDEQLDLLGYILKQRENGRIKNIGFSSHACPELLEKFLQYYDDYDACLLQINYLDWTLLDAKEQYEIATRHGIPVWVMEGLKGGILTELDDDSTSILKECAPERTLAEWGFRFLMGLENVRMVLSGMSTIDVINENLRIFDHKNPLPEDELKILFKAADKFKYRLGVPCSKCCYCRSVCPEKIDIPRVIQAFNEQKISGRTWKVANMRYNIEPRKCQQCGECQSICPQGINIPSIMEYFAKQPLGPKTWLGQFK